MARVSDSVPGIVSFRLLDVSDALASHLQSKPEQVFLERKLIVKELSPCSASGRSARESSLQ